MNTALSPEDRLEALERSTEQLERRIEELTGAGPECPARSGSLWRTGPVPHRGDHLGKAKNGDVVIYRELWPGEDPGCEWLRVSDLVAAARPDPLPLLRQAHQAMNDHVQDWLRETGGYEFADQLCKARDAIAAAYPEVTK